MKHVLAGRTGLDSIESAIRGGSKPGWERTDRGELEVNQNLVLPGGRCHPKQRPAANVILATITGSTRIRSTIKIAVFAGNDSSGAAIGAVGCRTEFVQDLKSGSIFIQPVQHARAAVAIAAADASIKRIAVELSIRALGQLAGKIAVGIVLTRSGKEGMKHGEFAGWGQGKNISARRRGSPSFETWAVP